MKAIGRGLAILSMLVLVACDISLSLDDLRPERGDLVSSASLGTHSPSATNFVIAALGIGGATAAYTVTCHRLTYKTLDTRGDLINASGLLCVPQKSFGVASPILSFQHGTILTDAEAPSSLNSRDYAFGQSFASLGYIAAAPDYVGYVISTDRLHPYLHAATLAAATVDMVRATRQFLQRNGIGTNGKLFLAGYSEGGYATLAAQREMELSLSNEFQVTASVPGAGPYDLTNTARTTLVGSTLGSAVFTAFFVRAYDAIYFSPSRLSAMFRPPFDGVVATSFDGSRDRGTVESLLTNVTADLFNEPFLSNFRGTGEAALKSRIAENDIYQWQPKAPTHFFHGEDDEIVPFANATTAVTTMQPSGRATLVSCNAGGLPTTHDNCTVPYVIYMLSFFATFSPGL